MYVTHWTGSVCLCTLPTGRGRSVCVRYPLDGVSLSVYVTHWTGSVCLRTLPTGRGQSVCVCYPLDGVSLSVYVTHWTGSVCLCTLPTGRGRSVCVRYPLDGVGLSVYVTHWTGSKRSGPSFQPSKVLMSEEPRCAASAAASSSTGLRGRSAPLSNTAWSHTPILSSSSSAWYTHKHRNRHRLSHQTHQQIQSCMSCHTRRSRPFQAAGKLRQSDTSRSWVQTTGPHTTLSQSTSVCQIRHTHMLVKRTSDTASYTRHAHCARAVTVGGRFMTTCTSCQTYSYVYL